MGNRRMMSKTVIHTQKFLKLPLETQALYFHLLLNADDDGIVEAFPVMRMIGANDDNLGLLVVKGFVVPLNDEMVYFIVDFREQNTLRKDRYVPSIYKNLLDEMYLATNVKPDGNQMATTGCPNIIKDNISKLNTNNNMSSKLDKVSEETKKTDHVDDDSEIDSGKVSSKQKNDSIPYDEIVEYLNQKASTNFRSSTPATQRLIKARLSEGFTVENFKSVIDIKTSQWLNNQKMNQYLRPQTLFGTKFESYLNECSLNTEPEYLTYLEEVEYIGDDIELPF
ncbi:conserved phage C-terminal domain-containing protein [Globicatella sp. PHS-GS-PNBC-21-1553]|uniref:conserved phage C-terminal domain-containing protein n=1 Tax=Globicatella sp. PHS-GS-PNBC-21-1553 TaxID=2885764 RepID=UPI00298ED6C7|nr:conserved phage C-terminal domain-containing protein [Globicatella sp. PHS-GS-PNBC-21-1553]WPC08805.1 conserved phage C-terminal domain-containing protein [Globicatella sp. PHS-GS-PNBC-21-1553]